MRYPVELDLVWLVAYEMVAKSISGSRYGEEVSPGYILRALDPRRQRILLPVGNGPITHFSGTPFFGVMLMLGKSLLFTEYSQSSGFCRGVIPYVSTVPRRY